MTAEKILIKHIDLFFSKNHYARFDDIPHSVFISAMEEYRAQFSKPSQEESGWISIEKELPGFKESVLVYFEITDKSGTSKYTKTAHLNNITKGKGYQVTEWKDDNFDNIGVEFWQPLPQPPTK